MLLCPTKAESNTGNDLVTLVAVNGARFGRAEKMGVGPRDRCTNGVTANM